MDGAQLLRNSNGTNITIVAARPTVGVFELNGNPDIPSVEYVYAGLTHTGAKKDYDARMFYMFYRDGRNLLKADNKHGTFFQILPTPRIYARFPFFNMINMNDNFVQAILRPGSRITIRSDYRWLRLNNAADLWYSGGGSYQKQTFGFSGRPSGGSRDLGDLADASIDYKLTPKTTLTFYFGHASGGKVISAIYPAGPNGNLAFWELSHRF